MVLQGVIRPPPEIRAVADRTALYVAKNGRAFESRILGSEKGKTPKFAFLHGTSPFHAYYEERIQFYEQGGVDEEPEQKKDETKKEDKATVASKPQKVKTVTSSVIDPVAKIVLAQRSKIAELRKQHQEGDDSEKRVPASVPPPPPLHFINIVAPSTLTVPQMETMQLVAQFTALDRKFLLQLTNREWNNPEFAFCQPRHGYFAYFSALVDAYRQVLNTWSASSNSNNPAHQQVRDLTSVEACLEEAAYRVEYDRYVAQQNQDSDKVVQINWHDFVIVETIDFAIDETVEMGIMPPPPPPMSIPYVATATPPTTNVSEEYTYEDEDQEQIRLVPNYQPRVVGTDTKAPRYMIDPITGKSVAVEDMPEHMRIQLLDPKWAEERKKFQEKQKDSNLVSGDLIASNLARMTQARGGLAKEQNLLTTESDSKKRLAEANRVIREQAQDAPLGPSLPKPSQQQQQQPSQTTIPEASQYEPQMKRPRIDKVTIVEAPPQSNASRPAPPPPLPPPGFETMEPVPRDLVSTAVVDPFAVAGEVQTPTMASKETELLSEAEFIATLSKPDVVLQVRIPNDRTQVAWNFYGQIVSETTNVMSTVKAVKQQLSQKHLNAMPINKIQLKASSGAFLKDNMTLAALNIGPTASVEVVPRARGGRK